MKWLGITNSVPQVADMATDLASLLRAAVSGNKVISLEGELELLERYLDIQSLRFGDSFTWEMDIPDCLQHCLIPKLVLQPLVENAIIHGVSDMPDGYIKISARAENNDLLLSVSDNGQGMSPELLSCLNAPDRELPEGHLGLNNVQRIVRLYYGEGYGISAKAGEKGGSVVQIRLPMVKKEVEDA
jgi:two-component system sensor histidine kinase YesM